MKRLQAWPVLLAALIAVGVLGFYYWTVGAPKVFAGPQPDYYNLLVDGFRAGRLSLDLPVEVDVATGQPRAKYFLDTSFYQGKYYLYFGVTPAVLLFWPWAVVTGHDLPEALAVALLAGLAFGLSVGWLRTLQRRFFPEAGAWFWVLAVLMLGIGSGYPVVLRRPLFYEVAVLAGVASSMAGLWCLTLAVLRREQAVRWLAWGSLCAGLAAGSRPTLTPGAVLAVAVAAGWIAWRERSEAAGWKWERGMKLGLAAVLPAGICGLLLGWYNWARFGNPLDFGLLHQVGSNAGGFAFTWGSLVHNLGLYYFTAPSFSWFFPFFGVGSNPPGLFREQAHGQMLVLPCLLLAAVAGGWALWRGRGRGSAAGAVAGVAGVWCGVVLVLDCMAPPHANRYQLDFHPILVAGLLVVLGAGRRLGEAWRWPVRLASGWCLVVVGFNVCTSFAVHGFFRESDPEGFARIARVADRLVWPLHQLAGPRLGGFEAMVRFAEGKPGTIEPLVVTGGGQEMDAVLVRYVGPGRGRLLFVHLDHGEVEGPDFDLLPGRVRWLKVHLGSLYPPPWHPWYAAEPAGMSRARNRLSVKLDGVEVLDRDAVFFQASANQVRLGERGEFPIGAERFSGQVVRVRGLRADREWLAQMQKPPGALEVVVRLPRDRYGQTEPLVMTGAGRRRDLVSVEYVRENVVRLSYLHEGWPAALKSREMAWDYREPLEVRVDMGSLRAPQHPYGEVAVEVAGEVVLQARSETHPAQPVERYVGITPTPVSGVRRIFGGEVLSVTPLAVDGAELRRTKQALLAGRMVRLRVGFPAVARSEPIFSTGITGRGDSLYVERLAEGRVRFGFDHWGSQATLSEPVEIEPGRIYTLEVALGAQILESQTVPGHLRVRLDGRTVFDRAVELFPAGVEQVFLGANPIGLSTSGPLFTGRMELPGGLRVGLDAPAGGLTKP